NRVYQVGIEAAEPWIAKFYRPGRWRAAQIHEEHDFTRELAEHELPVVAPLCRDGESLFGDGDSLFSLSPRRGGHAPELDDLDNLRVLGRLLGRMHRVGASRPFVHRPRLDSRRFGHDSVAFIRAGFIPADLAHAYQTLTDDLLAA